MIRIRQGDCREVMQTFDACSVDAVVCDPPYELGFMGKGWDSTGVANDPETWKAALRVLKPGGHLLAFSGTRTYHRMVCAIEDAGFEIRDQIGWVYGSGFPKSKNLDGEWQGWGTALKPAWEPIVLARKPLVGTVAANVLQHGTGALNIDGCRVPTEDHYSYPNGAGGNGFHGGVGRPADGSRIDTPEMNPRGRWPANIILSFPSDAYELTRDGRDVLSTFALRWSAMLRSNEDASGDFESRAQRIDLIADILKVGGRIDEKTFGALPDCLKELFRKLPNPGSDEVLAAFPEREAAPRGPHRGPMGYQGAAGYDAADGVRGYLDSGSAARFFYTAKASAFDRNDGAGKNTHPTVKPTDLMRYLCRLVTPQGGTILDMFMGSGSTLKAAELEGFSAIGIELDPAYIEIARRRIASDAPLFAEVA